MPLITVNDQPLQVDHIIKLRPYSELDARPVARTDGADNIFFEVGQDTYIASAKALDLGNIRDGARIRFQDKAGQIAEGHITWIDDENNGIHDYAIKLKEGAIGGLVAGFMSAGITTLYALGARVPLLKALPGAGKMGAIGAAVVMGAVTLVNGLDVLHSRHKADQNALQQFAVK